MKKLYSFCAATLICSQLFAGGIVTNTNQSAQFVRMQSRNASFGIDAVYYNPAGLMMMDNGFHLALHNQSVFQSRTITTTYTGLNQSEFLGAVTAPLFPTFFAVYKMDKLALSFGFGPNGGGGSAEFASGLPSFEMLAASLPMLMSANGIPTDTYSADIYFEGNSIYYGSQLNFSYKINDMVSLGAGLRMINAKNAYKGHLQSIMTNPMHPLNPDGMGNLTSTTAFFGTLSATAYGAAGSMQPLIDGGGGSLTLEQAEGMGFISAEQRIMLAAGLGANYDPAMNIEQVQYAYNVSGATAEGYANSTGDALVDAAQTGLAFTPILSANISPMENLNIAIKYEFNTNLTMTNDTKLDYNDMFKHDSSFRADIPGILAIGVNYGITDKFRTQLSFTTYFDKQADWGGREKLVDNNLWELALGFEYDVVDNISCSAGWSMGKTGVSDAFQSDLSYSNSSNTFGLGGQWRATEQLSIDLGAMMSFYQDFNVETNSPPMPAYSTTYAKETFGFAIGVGYSF